MRNDEPTAVEVVVAATDWLGEAPSWLWIGEFTLTRGDARSIRDELEGMLPEPSPEEGYIPHRVSESSGRTSWGSDSGDFLNISLFLARTFAEGWIAVTTARLYERLAARHRGDGSEDWREPLSRTEAIEQARWTITQKYRELTRDSLTDVPNDPESLALLSESHEVDADLWKIALRDRQGAVYRVTLGTKAGIPIPKIIERDAPPARQ